MAASLVLLLALASCHAQQPVQEVQQLIDRGEHARAQQRVLEALKQAPNHPGLWRLRIDLALARNQISEAVGAYKERARVHGEDRELLRYLSLAAIRWALERREAEIRLAAIQAARDTDASDLEGDVADRLADPSELVRTWAAIAMSQTPEGADVLEKQLRSPDPQARRAALGGVARIAGPASVNVLLGFAGDPDASVRSAAAVALGNTRKPEVLPALLRLAQDSVATVRADAVAAIGRAGLRSASEAVRRSTSDPQLVVRLAAVTALADLGQEDAAAALRSIAAGEDELAALRAGARLSRLGEVQPALNAIARALVDRQWTVRAAGCNTAATVKDGVARLLVRPALRDSDARVRLAAARTLAGRSGADQQEAVAAALVIQRQHCPRLESATVALCAEAAEILALVDEPAGRVTLQRLARSAPSAAGRLSALRQALALGAPLSLALEALADADGEVAMAAAAWLYRRLS